MNKNKLLTMLVFSVIAVVFMAASVAAVSITSTPGEATEGKLYKYDINVDASNQEFTHIWAVGFTPKESSSLKLDKATGMMEWIPGAKETGEKEFRVRVLDTKSKTAQYFNFKVKVKPVLEITEVKAGLKGQALVSYDDGKTTAAFKPGQEIIVQAKLQNKFTSSSHEIIKAKDVKGDLEQVVLSLTPQGISLGTANVTDTSGNKLTLPLFIQEGGSKEVQFHYKIPTTVADGEHNLVFTSGARDLDNPPHKFTNDQRSVKLKVKRDTHSISLVKAEFVDAGKDGLTCSEKAADASLKVTLENLGASLAPVTIEVTNTALGISSKTDVALNSNDKKEFTVKFDGKEIVGKQPLTVEVYRVNAKVAPYIYATTTVEVDGKNCPVSFKSSATTVTTKEDTASKALKLSDLINNAEKKQTVSFSVVAQPTNAVASISNGMLTVNPKANFFGTDSFKIKANDGVSTAESTINVVVTKTNDDLPTVKSTSPAASVALKANQAQKLKIEVDNPDTLPLVYKWKIDGKVQSANTGEFTFTKSAKGTYKVNVEVTSPANSKVKLTYDWTVTVNDRPIDINKFSGSKTTDLSKVGDITKVSKFTLDNNFATIEYTPDVNLLNILELAKVVALENGLVAVDSANAAALNKPAKITIKKAFTNPIIQKSTGFKSGSFVQCPTTECVEVSKGSEYVFTVQGFSTYRVVEKQPAGIEISNILVDGVDTGKTKTITVTVKNTGSLDPLTGVSASLVGVDSKYNAKITTLPSTITAGNSATLSLTVTIPSNEDSGEHSIGLLRIASTQVTKDATIKVNPNSLLKIKDFEVNGKSSGDLKPNDKNDFEVTVKNEGSKDMEDVTVTVTILNVDGDDLDDESNEFDIDDGDSETEKLEIDLRGEDVDEDEYTIEVLVEGEDTDGRKHSTKERFKVDVDREKHQVEITRASLSSQTLSCSRTTGLSVEIENTGRNDEKDVVIQVRNSALGLNLKKTDIRVDKFSDSDNDYRTTFSIDVGTAKAGSYPITVEVFRDDDKSEDTETVTLTVNDCGSSQSSSSSSGTLSGGLSASDLAAKLQAELQQALGGTTTTAAQNDGTVTSVSFRESDNYVLLMGALVVLLFIALVLGLGVLAVRKR